MGLRLSQGKVFKALRGSKKKMKQILLGIGLVALLGSGSEAQGIPSSTKLERSRKLEIAHRLVSCLERREYKFDSEHGRYLFLTHDLLDKSKPSKYLYVDGPSWYAMFYPVDSMRYGKAASGYNNLREEIERFFNEVLDSAISKLKREEKTARCLFI